MTRPADGPLGAAEAGPAVESAFFFFFFLVFLTATAIMGMAEPRADEDDNEEADDEEEEEEEEEEGATLSDACLGERCMVAGSGSGTEISASSRFTVLSVLVVLQMLARWQETEAAATTGETEEVAVG